MDASGFFYAFPKTHRFLNIAGKLRVPHTNVLRSFSMKKFYDLLETEGLETQTHKRGKSFCFMVVGSVWANQNVDPAGRAGLARPHMFPAPAGHGARRRILAEDLPDILRSTMGQGH